MLFTILIISYINLHLYFWLFSQDLVAQDGKSIFIVRDSGDVAPGFVASPVLRYKLFSWPPAVRAVVCMLPVLSGVLGIGLDEINVLAVMCLILLFEPMSIPFLRLEDSKRDNILKYSLGWLMSESQRVFQFTLWLIPFTLVFWISGLDYWFGLPPEYLSWVMMKIDIWWFLGEPSRVENAINLPPSFYLLCALVLLWRTSGAVIATWENMIFATFVWFVGLSGLAHFFRITGQLTITETGWGFPIEGIVLGISARIAWDWVWSKYA